MTHRATLSVRCHAGRFCRRTAGGRTHAASSRAVVSTQARCARAWSAEAGVCGVTVRLRPMISADLPAVLDLERELFPEDAWTPRDVRRASSAAGRRAGTTWSPKTTGSSWGTRDCSRREHRPGGPAPGGQADVLTMAVATARWGQGIGSALLRGAAGRGGRPRLRRDFPRGPGGQPAGAAALPQARVHRGRAAPRLLPAERHGRPGDAAAGGSGRVRARAGPGGRRGRLSSGVGWHGVARGVGRARPPGRAAGPAPERRP